MSLRHPKNAVRDELVDIAQRSTLVGWVGRSETHHLSAQRIDGFRFALPILLIIGSCGVSARRSPDT